jgi:PTH1 family peptidyl-tRNA hydrolase
MGLFQRQQPITEKASLFSIGLNKSLLIVGLGNIGKEYDDTKHNVGFKIVDNLVSSREELGKWQDKKNLKSHFTMGQFGDTRIIVIKPTTLMNLSGEAVQAVSNFYKIAPSQILVVHDELDIKFGQIRTGIEGSSAGHNGVQSIIEQIGANFNRLRIGIGPKKPAQIDSADFVLSKFNKDQMGNMDELVKEATSMIIEFIFSGEINKETRTFLV